MASSYPSTSSSSSAVGPNAWESRRRKARTLESQVDSRLTSYSSLASTISRGASSGSSSNDVESGESSSLNNLVASHTSHESEISSLIHQLSEAINSLAQLLDDPELPPSTVQLHAVQRHREVLSDFERDFRRARDNVRHAVDRYELVGRVRGDIDAYKAQQYSSDQEALLAERGRLDNSHSMMDGTLEQAYATLTDFQEQRRMLTNVSNRMGSTLSQIPALNGVMTMIGRRRRRDSVIMGIVIGTLTVLLLMFMTR